jgi:iron complex outermembrane receptor protein
MLFMFFLFSGLVFCQFPDARANNRRLDLTALSIEELMNIEITSVSKKAQALSQAAAAVYVITQEDIRRSGVTSIPEALRMVPGLQVAHITGNKWAISARGFSDLVAKFLLVLIDGRNVYSPLFGGVNWDEVDTLLADIERIEVIRGPGGTLWGANAVNGVINITTKKAKDTQGGLLTFGGGNYEEGFGGVRYGGKARDTVHYRTYIKYFDRDNFADHHATSADRIKLPGKHVRDRWDAVRGGFRIDWDPSDTDAVTLQGDIYRGDIGETLLTTSPSRPYMSIGNHTLRTSGFNILTNWHRTFSDISSMKLKCYYDYVVRDDVLFRETRNTFDLDFQHRLALGGYHDIVWGAQYNFTSDHLRDSFTVSFSSDDRDLNVASLFFQDDIALYGDRVHLIVGSKFEYNDYTDFEVQPTGRLLWNIRGHHVLWAAVSRAVKIPNRGNREGRINFLSLPLFNLAISPNRNYKSEEVTAFELGYRVRPTDNLSFDIAGFYTDYDNLLDLNGDRLFLEGDLPPRLVLPLRQDNDMYGHSYGTEIAVTWQVTGDWKLVAGYTWLKLQLDSHLSTDRYRDREDSDPENQCNVRSYLSLPGNLEFDSALYYVDRVSRWDIPSYLRLDARLGWHPTKDVSISLVMHNLLDDHHPEYSTEQGFISSQVKRSIYMKVAWYF